jgi:tetratricopeptide (TPR) repeat protein
MKKTLAILLGMAFFIASSSALSQEEIATVMSMKAALKKEPENPAFLSELGLAYLKNQQFQKAIPPLEKSLVFQKNNFQSHFYLALAYGAVGRHTEKLKELQGTLRINPDYAEANFKIGLAHAALNRHQEASEYYRKAIKLKPDNNDTHYFLALSCILSNR